jgi:hypothetical protein
MGTHYLESTGKTFQDTEQSQRDIGTHTLSSVEGGTYQDTENSQGATDTHMLFSAMGGAC